MADVRRVKCVRRVDKSREAEFQRRLGVRKIVWIADGGLAGDDTDGHIDQQARFVQENVLVVAASEDADDSITRLNSARSLRGVSRTTTSASRGR